MSENRLLDGVGKPPPHTRVEIVRRTLLTYKGVEYVLGDSSPWTSRLSTILQAAYLPFVLDDRVEITLG